MNDKSVDNSIMEKYYGLRNATSAKNDFQMKKVHNTSNLTAKTLMLDRSNEKMSRVSLA